MTPFYRKSEFWVALCTGVTGVLICCGVVTPEKASDINVAVQQIVGGVMTIASALRYMTGQTRAKTEVFHEMCAASWTRAPGPDAGVGAQSLRQAAVNSVMDSAKAAGL